MRFLVGGWSGRSRVVRALVAVLVGAATVLGPLAAPTPAAAQGDAVPDRPERPVADAVGHDFVTLSWEDPGDPTITGYQILRRNRDVDALGDFTIVEDDTASTDTVYTDRSVDAATNYGYRIKARNAHGLSLRSKAARVETLAEPETAPETEPETESSESAESPSERDSDPESPTDPGTETGTDFVGAWTSVLDVGATDGTVGYSRWAKFGSLSPDRFDVDGTTYQVMLLAEIAGGLYLGLRASLDVEFVLEVDGERFVGSQSLVPGGLALRGTYWWPADGVVSGSVGGAVDVSLSVGTDALGERGASPPGAWFSQVPDAHDGSSQFTLRLNVDESDVGVTAGSMADALTVAGGSLAAVSEVSPEGRTWELTVAPDGPGDVTVSLPAPTDCVTALSVCSSDGRMLRNSPQATVQGPDEASDGASLPVGATVRGQIETPQDEDWFAMELVKGHTYQINLDGPARPYVAEVLDPAGNVISEETDPGGGSNGSEGSPQPRYRNIDGITGISGITKAPGVQTAGWDQDGAAAAPIDDGDGLKRSAPSSDPPGGTDTADTTAFGDGWVQITPAETGTYYLSTRSDKGTGGYEVSLRQVTDDYPADTTTTGTVAVGGTAMGEIEQAGDTDWFKVENLEAGKAYLVDLMGAQTGDGTLRDPYLAGIHNSSGTRISGTANDDRGAGTNSRVRFTPASDGTYYVAASGAGDRIGTYTLAVTQQSDDFDATATGTTGTVTVGGTATGVIEAEGDHDWFAVTLAANKTYRFDAKGKQLFQSLNGTLRNPYIDSLYRSDGTRIAGTGINDGGSYWDARIDHTATTAGTYYLSVGGYGEGTYTVAVTDITGGPPDDHPADTTTTGEIDVGGTADGEVQFHGDDDWFKVTLEANKTYYIDLMALHLTKGTLDWPTLHGIHDSTGTLVAGTANNDTFDGPSTSDREVFTPATTGVYYVAAGGPRLFVREGTYTVRVTDMTPGQTDDHPATTASTAAATVDDSVTARSEQAGDRDWYKVSLTAGNVYRFDLMGAWTGDGTLADPVLHGIRKADGTLIAGTSDRDSGTYTNDRAFFTPTTTADYFVDAGGAGVGTYTLAVTNIPDSSDDYPATTGTSGSLAIDGSVTGDIGHPDDRDWFEVTLEANAIYQFDLKGGPTGDGLPGFGTLGDPHLHGIHDSMGTRIAGTSDDDSGVHNYSRVRYRATATGKHYVSAGGDSGTYTLFAAALGTDDHPANTGTTGTVTVGGSATGDIEREGDRDWFKVTLDANKTYRIELKGARTRDGTLRDPHLTIPRGPSGPLSPEPADDDSGIGGNSLLTFTPTTGGVHYISSGAHRDWTGTYTLYVTEV